jgi:hypothetical protein
VQIEIVKSDGITNISQQEYDVTFSFKAMKTSNPNPMQTFDHTHLKASVTSSSPSHLSFVSIIVGAFAMASRRLFPPIGVAGPLSTDPCCCASRGYGGPLGPRAEPCVQWISAGMIVRLSYGSLIRLNKLGLFLPLREPPSCS